MLFTEKNGSSPLANCVVIDLHKKVTFTILPNKSFYASKTLLFHTKQLKVKNIPNPPNQPFLPNYLIFIKIFLKKSTIFVILLLLYHIVNPTFS